MSLNTFYVNVQREFVKPKDGNEFCLNTFYVNVQLILEIM